MKPWIALLLLALPLPALADTCQRWTAEMQEDEGGSVMTAYICAPTGNATHELSVTCGSSGKLSFRFNPVAPAGYPPDVPEFKTQLEYNFDQEMFTTEARYEEMDGALVSEMAIDSAFMGVIEAQKEMSILDTDGKLPDVKFTLKGAKKALKKVIATCQ